MKRETRTRKGNKAPASQFYWSDLEVDTGWRLLSLSGRGLWMSMLAIMHSSPRRGFLLLPNEQPPTLEQLSKIVCAPAEEVEKARDEILSMRVASITEDGVIFNRRMVREADSNKALSRARSEAGRRGMESRWSDNKHNKPDNKLDNKPITNSDNKRITNDNKGITNDNKPKVVESVIIPGPSIENGITNDSKPITKYNSPSPTPSPSPVLIDIDLDPSTQGNNKPEEPADPKIFDLTKQDLSSGRFCLRKFNFMWMHQWELEDARKLWKERSGMTQEEWRDGLKVCNVSMEQKKHVKEFKGGLAYKYLTTHILTDKLQQKRNGKTVVPEPKRVQPPLHRATPREKTKLEPISEVLTGISHTELKKVVP